MKSIVLEYSEEGALPAEHLSSAKSLELFRKGGVARALLFGSTCGLLLYCAATSAQEAPSPGKPPRPLVAVLFLEDRTGDPAHASWRSLVNEILSEKLALVKAIRVARRSSINGAYSKTGHDRGASIGIESARRIGEHLEAQRIVSGFYERQGSGWRVSVRIFRTAAGTASDEITASGNDWFDICEALASEVLRDLRSSPSAEERELMKRRWTSSSRALQFFADAMFAADLKEPVSLQEAHVNKALAADPSCAWFHWMAGALAGTRGRLLDPEASARSALGLQPSFPAAHRLLGHALLAQRRRAEGLVELRQARTLDPDDPEALHLLKTVAGEEEAIRLMEAAAELDRTDSRIHTHLAQLYLARSEPAKAFDALLEAERLQLGLPIEVQQLFLVYQRMGEASRALSYYQQLLASRSALDPQLLSSIEPMAERLRVLLVPSAVEVALPRSLRPEDVERALLDGASPSEKMYLVNPLAGGPRMKERAERIVAGCRGELSKARALHDAIAGRVAGKKTKPKRRTALEALEDWNSSERFSSSDRAKLYTSLAREAGLQAFYTVVEKDAHGRILEHVCSAVVADGKVYLADPTYFWFGAPHVSFQLLDDIQAVAVHLMEVDGNRDLALAMRRMATRLWPESHLTWFALSFACMESRDWEAAREAARLGVERSPKHYMATLVLGSMASCGGELDKAEALLRTVAIPGSPLAVVHYELGAVLAAQGKLEASIAELRAGRRAEPQGPRAEWASRGIAKIQEHLTQGGSPEEGLSLEKPAD